VGLGGNAESLFQLVLFHRMDMTVYSILAKKAVLMVLTLGQKSSNMQPTEVRIPVGQQDRSRLLVWRQYAMPLHGVTSFLDQNLHHH
jgi:hypothetical protein